MFQQPDARKIPQARKVLASITSKKPLCINGHVFDWKFTSCPECEKES